MRPSSVAMTSYGSVPYMNDSIAVSASGSRPLPKWEASAGSTGAGKAVPGGGKLVIDGGLPNWIENFSITLPPVQTKVAGTELVVGFRIQAKLIAELKLSPCACAS